MDTKPVSLESVFLPNKKVIFFAHTDPALQTGYEFVQEVTTDANGVATLTATPPAGKTLCASCHTIEGGEPYQRFRVFTDNF